MQSDPVGLGGGINTYGYGYQSPLRFIDPLGLWSCDGGVANPAGVPTTPAEGAAAWAQGQYEADNQDYLPESDNAGCGGAGKNKCNCFVKNAFEEGGNLPMARLPRHYVNGKPGPNFAMANDLANTGLNTNVLGIGSGKTGDIVAWPSSQRSGHTGILGCDGKIYSATKDGIARWNRDYSWQQFIRYQIPGREKVYRECCN